MDCVLIPQQACRLTFHCSCSPLLTLLFSSLVLSCLLFFPPFLSSPNPVCASVICTYKGGGAGNGQLSASFSRAASSAETRKGYGEENAKALKRSAEENASALKGCSQVFGFLPASNFSADASGQRQHHRCSLRSVCGGLDNPAV